MLIGLVVLFVISFGYIIFRTMDQYGEVRCTELLDQSKKYPSFFLSEMEKKQCDEIGIKIDAPVGAPDMRKVQDEQMI